MMKWLRWIGLGLLVLVLLFRGLDWVARRGGPLPAPPQPNAYDELLVIAGKVKLPASELSELSGAQAREVARDNRAALEQIHAVLKADSAVPLKIERGWSERHEAEVKKLKRLAVALAMQSRADRAEGHTNDSVRCHLDMILLGQAMARGGLLFDGISALAVETLGAGALRGDVLVMDAALCRDAARELEQAEKRREPPERILETEKRWSSASFGLVSRVGGLLMRGGEARRRSNFLSRSDQTVRRTRRLMLLLAARSFELETGRFPGQVTDLVPRILAEVPVDPASGSAFTDIPRASEE